MSSSLTNASGPFVSVVALIGDKQAREAFEQQGLYQKNLGPLNIAFKAMLSNKPNTGLFGRSEPTKHISMKVSRPIIIRSILDRMMCSCS